MPTCVVALPPAPTSISINATSEASGVTLPSISLLPLPEVPSISIPSTPSVPSISTVPPDISGLLELLGRISEQVSDLDDEYVQAFRQVYDQLLVRYKVALRQILTSYSDKLLRLRTDIASRNMPVIDGGAEYAYFRLQQAELEEIRKLEIDFIFDLVKALESALDRVLSLFLASENIKEQLLRAAATASDADRSSRLAQYQASLELLRSEYDRALQELEQSILEVRRSFLQEQFKIVEYEQQLINASKAIIEKEASAELLMAAKELYLAQLEEQAYISEANLIAQESRIIAGKQYEALLRAYRADYERMRASLEVYANTLSLQREQLRLAETRIDNEKRKISFNREIVDQYRRKAGAVIDLLESAYRQGRQKLSLIRERLQALRAEYSADSAEYKVDLLNSMLSVRQSFHNYLMNEILPRYVEITSVDAGIRARHREVIGDMRVDAIKQETKYITRMTEQAGVFRGNYAWAREYIRADIVACANVTANIIRSYGAAV